MLGVAIAEFEGEPAEDQRQQHQQDREIDGRNDDGEGDRKGGEQADAPRMSQVSLPSQIGAIEFITSSRALRSGAKLWSMPTPRSKPSSAT